MAYINCALCNAQSYPVVTTEMYSEVGLQAFLCTSKHLTYVEKEDLDGSEGQRNESGNGCC